MKGPSFNLFFFTSPDTPDLIVLLLAVYHRTTFIDQGGSGRLREILRHVPRYRTVSIGVGPGHYWSMALPLRPHSNGDSR
jgi:hypothetical protein